MLLGPFFWGRHQITQGWRSLHRVGNEPLTDFWTTGLSVWWVWCWGQSLSLPESVHIWAAATSGTIKAANKRNVGQADEYSNVTTEHAAWINALIQRWPSESYGGPLRLKEDIIKKPHSRMNVRAQGQLQIDFDLRHKQTCCVYFLPLFRKFRTLPEW